VVMGFSNFFKFNGGDYYHPLVVFLSICLFLITLAAALFNFTFFGKYIVGYLSFIINPIEDALIPGWAVSLSDAPIGSIVLLIILVPIALAIFTVTFFGTMIFGIFLIDKILRPLDEFLTRNWEREEE
jgi:hypothetical protein